MHSVLRVVSSSSCSKLFVTVTDEIYMWTEKEVEHQRQRERFITNSVTAVQLRFHSSLFVVSNCTCIFFRCFYFFFFLCNRVSIVFLCVSIGIAFTIGATIVLSAFVLLGASSLCRFRFVFFRLYSICTQSINQLLCCSSLSVTCTQMDSSSSL